MVSVLLLAKKSAIERESGAPTFGAAFSALERP